MHGVTQLCLLSVQAILLTLPAGGLSLCESKLVAVATKLVSCPALLLLEEPFAASGLPCDRPAAQHLLRSLQIAAEKLHINIVVAEEMLPEAIFMNFPHALLLDQAGLPGFAGAPSQVRLTTCLRGQLCHKIMAFGTFESNSSDCSSYVWQLLCCLSAFPLTSPIAAVGMLAITLQALQACCLLLHVCICEPGASVFIICEPGASVSFVCAPHPYPALFAHKCCFGRLWQLLTALHLDW